MSKKTAHVVIDLVDVREAGGVQKAIAAWCEYSDDTVTGVVGSEFSTSGPGPGWTRNHDTNDFASRAFANGALYYLDSADGRMKSAVPAEDDDDDAMTDIGGCRYVEGEWTDESVVRVECPSVEDALEYPELVAEMARSVVDYHHAESDRAEWRDLITAIRKAAEMLEDIDTDSLAD